MKWWALLYPSCLNCHHYRPSPLDIKYNDMGKCLLYPQVIEKKIIYPYAEKVRQDEKKCGLTAKDWVPEL